MSIYLRLKRHNQTLFLHCDPNDCVSELKKTVCAILSDECSSPDDIRFYENLTESRRTAIIEERQKAAAARAAEEKKNKGKKGTAAPAKTALLAATTALAAAAAATTAAGAGAAPGAGAGGAGAGAGATASPTPTSLSSSTAASAGASSSTGGAPVGGLGEDEPTCIPPLDETRTLSELGIDNDHIVYFVFRTTSGEWEPISVREGGGVESGAATGLPVPLARAATASGGASAGGLLTPPSALARAGSLGGVGGLEVGDDDDEEDALPPPVIRTPTVPPS